MEVQSLVLQLIQQREHINRFSQISFDNQIKLLYKMTCIEFNLNNLPPKLSEVKLFNYFLSLICQFSSIYSLINVK